MTLRNAFEDLATEATVSGILTNSQLRAAPLPISGTVTVSSLGTLATSANQSSQTTLLQAIADNTDGIELSLTDIDINTDGIETALSGVLTELGQKLEAGDVTGLATSAKQSDIITALGGTLAVNTELPAAAALTDADANPTVPGVGGFNMGWYASGSVWKRLTVTSGGLLQTSGANSDGDALSNTSTGQRNLSAGYVYNGTTWDRVRGSAVEGMRTYDRPDDVTTGTITANNQSVATAAVKDGMSSFGLLAYGTQSGTTISVEGSPDSGTTWKALMMNRADSGSSSAASQFAPGNNGVGFYVGGIPPGMTQVRVTSTAWTSGSLSVRLSQSQVSVAPTIGLAGTPTVALASGTNSIGAVGSSARWQDDTATPLAGAGTFTGTSRDSTGVGAGTTAASFTNEARAIAISDVSGTLHLEVSRDNSTFRRVKSVATTLVATGGLYTAELRAYPAMRYYRLIYVNDAGAQGHFTLSTMQL